MNDDAIDTILTQLFMAGTVDYSLMEAVMEAKAAIQAYIQEAVVAETLEKMKILSALADMYGQYCDGPYGHDFMGAGEGAIEILENYKLASEDKGIDYVAVDKLDEYIAQLQSKD